MTKDQRAELEWTGRTPVSTRFGDPYFSTEDGLAETAHVFLEGNGLPGRFRPGFQIAELGFGTGLNMLAAWRLWRKSGQSGPLRFTSFEAFPMGAGDIRKALAAFPGLLGLAEPFLTAWSRGETRFEMGDLIAEIVLGDANTNLPAWAGCADAWFLDGFAPAKNPELWSPALMAEVARHTAPSGTIATYTAAGFIRRGLEAAGIEVTRKPGYGRKRHMTTGILKAR